MPYLIGDALAAIHRAAKAGLKWIDQNGNVTLDGWCFILHWRRYRLQFPFYWTGRRTKGGREIRRPVPASWPRYFDHLTKDQAERLRSSLVGGKRPRLARAHMLAADAWDVNWCLEGKGSPGFTQEVTWDRLDEWLASTQARAVFMCLTSWPNWRRMVAMAHSHGWAVAVLPRTAKPADWAAREGAMGVQVWGRWR